MCESSGGLLHRIPLMKRPFFALLTIGFAMAIASTALALDPPSDRIVAELLGLKIPDADGQVLSSILSQ